MSHIDENPSGFRSELSRLITERGFSAVEADGPDALRLNPHVPGEREAPMREVVRQSDGGCGARASGL